jgi:hypothetical protein
MRVLPAKRPLRENGATLGGVMKAVFRSVMIWAVLTCPCLLRSTDLGDLKHFCGFTLNETNYDDVTDRWGQGKWSETGDAGDTDKQLKYRYRDIIINFEGDELSGLRFDTVELSRADSNQIFPIAPIKTRPQLAGFHIGMTRAEFKANLRRYAKHPLNYHVSDRSSTDTELDVHYEGTKMVKVEDTTVHWDQFDDWLWVDAKFSQEKLIWLKVATGMSD